MKKILFLCILFLSATYAAPSVRVATIIDADTAENRDTLLLFQDEITKLSKGEFDVSFPKSKQLTINWSGKQAKSALSSLEQDPKVDIIIAIGHLSSQVAIKQKIFKKPTFAPLVFDKSLSGLADTKNGSGIRNLNYIAGNSNIQNDIESFREVAPFQKAVFLLDSSQYEMFSQSIEKTIESSRKKGILLSFVASYSQNEDISAKIPKDAEAVLIAPLPKLDDVAKQKLIGELIKRKIPSFSFGADITAKDGLLASLDSSADMLRKARRTALNIIATLRGENADTQPVFVDKKRELTINMATAKAINIYPNFSILKNATLINETDEKLPQLTLEGVAAEAVKNNLGVIMGQLGVEADKENIASAKSVLFPHISAQLGHTRLNQDNIYVQNGMYAEKSTTGSIKVTQLLFSEKALANLEIQKQLQISTEKRQKSLELEVSKGATTAFLGLLLAQTNLKIQKNNLALTKTNLELAKKRLQSGASSSSDVYYWQSAIASSQQRLLYANSEVEKAKDRLSVILNRPMDKGFSLSPTTFDDKNIIEGKRLLLTTITNRREKDAMYSFFVDEAIDGSAELGKLKAEIAAQQRQLQSDKASYWMPEISLFGEKTHVFNETRKNTAGIDLNGKTDWQTGAVLTLPIYEGGATTAKSSRSRIKLMQAQTSYQNTKATIEQEVRNDLHAIEASYPSIELAIKAAEAADKNLVLVQENYAQGTRTLSDLLTAQNTSLSADQAAAESVYRFLIDLMQLQRDIGSADAFLGDAARSRVIDRLKRYISDNGRKGQ